MNLEVPLKEIDGTEVMETKDGDERVVTVKDMIIRALLAPTDVKPDAKLDQGVLSLRVHQGVSELSAEETTTIMKAVKRVYPPLIVLRVAEVIDTVAVNKLKGTCHTPEGD